MQRGEICEECSQVGYILIAATSPCFQDIRGAITCHYSDFEHLGQHHVLKLSLQFSMIFYDTWK